MRLPPSPVDVCLTFFGLLFVVFVVIVGVGFLVMLFSSSADDELECKWLDKDEYSFKKKQ